MTKRKAKEIQKALRDEKNFWVNFEKFFPDEKTYREFLQHCK